MSKHPTKKPSRQEQAAVNATTLQIPLPLISALEDAQGACFGLCVETGSRSWRP